MRYPPINGANKNMNLLKGVSVDMQSAKSSVQLISKRVLVEGKIQGLGYRHTLAELAREKNIWGCCRNVPDGRVEAVLQGEKSNVESLLTWMREGPPSATVGALHVENQALFESLLDESIQVFEIRK